jgi:RNA ligase (TIGR02306 family)
MSDHKCEIVPVVLQKHPNADSLSIVNVFDSYTVCVRTDDWVGIDKGVYLPPDTVVPDTEQFKFLEGHLRIKAKKLRGVESYGLLVPVPSTKVCSIENMDGRDPQIGDDFAEFMGMRHYEPELSAELKQKMGEQGDPPSMKGSDYDMEAFQKYGHEFVEGEEIIITEKINGTNARYTFQADSDGAFRMYCGSHHVWKKPGDNLYWNILKYFPWVEAFCRLNKDVILYGEIFGAVQKGFDYGSTPSNPYQFRAFDIFAQGRFLDYDDALGGAQSDFLVPVLYRGPFSNAIIQEYISGPSMIEGAKHIREGCVVKCVKERYSQRLHGRLILKFVSLDYLEGKKKK